jgi:hypothetical protein
MRGPRIQCALHKIFRASMRGRFIFRASDARLQNLPRIDARKDKLRALNARTSDTF